jgi:hypothetical protein
MEILGIVGFAFAATALGVLVYEHQTDVLHGPYIEGRTRPRGAVASWQPARALVEALIERLNWNARHLIYLASLV